MNKKEILFYIIISTCFLFGLFDFILSMFLLDTGYFMELNPLAYPYFLLIPIFLLFPKNDKLVLIAIGVLTIFLGLVVSINLINVVGYLQVVG